MEFYRQLCERMREVHEMARQAMCAAGVRQKRAYDTRCCGQEFHAGDPASGRTSAGDPPPSYDEAVGHADVHIETEPPPQYDDIVNNSSSNMIIGQGK